MTDTHNEEKLNEEAASAASEPQAAASEPKKTAPAASAVSSSTQAAEPAEKRQDEPVKENKPAVKEKKKKASKRKKEEKLSIPALICAILAFSLLYFWCSCIVPRLGEHVNPNEKGAVNTVLVLIDKAKQTFGQDRTPPPAGAPR
ncbi:hypothetical protein IJT93_07430 [bacterium]|nr:hypothetical protein [bacterium]